MRNITTLKAEFTAKTIEGRIRSLVQKLYKLAPNPNNSAQPGAFFISLDSAFKPAAEYDGMLGSLMLESFIGAAFADAMNDNGETTALNAIGGSHADVFAEGLSEYIEAQDDQKRGKGTFAQGEHKSICNIFNSGVDRNALAFERDLNMRVKIEKTIAHLNQELCAFTNLNTAPELQLCA